jgi:hypothetical protein
MRLAVFPVEVWQGRVPGISSAFGERKSGWHPGIDALYPARPGDPAWLGRDNAARSRSWYMPEERRALAAAAGRVWSVREQPNGWWVRLSHEGGAWNTLYGHLVRPLVEAGQDIAAGSPVGIIGGPRAGALRHLHFEVWDFLTHGKRVVDPAPALVGAEYRDEMGRPFAAPAVGRR